MSPRRGACSVKGCGREALTRGWCSPHYVRWRLLGSVGTLPIRPRSKNKPPGPCSIPGCTRPRLSRGWCLLHYGRWQRTGSPTALYWLGEARGITIKQGRVYVRIVSGLVPRAHAVWVQHNGPIPAPGLGLGQRWDQYAVRHRDENKRNDAIDNLYLITNGERVRNCATHCPRGHEYTEGNIYWQTRPGGQKHRQCRECRRAAKRRARRGATSLRGTWPYTRVRARPYAWARRRAEQPPVAASS